MRIAIISGSARAEGNTSSLITNLQKHINADSYALLEYQINHYRYDHNYKNDEFISLVKNVIENYDTIIFVTPVYWYSMSGRMKVFFDRMTDMLKIEKELGRKLRGKNMAVATTSNGGNLEGNFWVPFIETADYLGMNYLGNLHTYQDLNYDKELLEFVSVLK